MIPGAAVVAGPGSGIALRAGIRRARKHEGPFLGLQFAQSVVSRPDVLHAEHIMDGAMIEAGAVVEAVHRIKGHGLIGAQKKRRFIHVIPETRRAHAYEVFVEPAPPVARAHQGKIRKHTFTRPDGTDVNRAIGILHEHIVLHSRVVRRIAMVGILLDVQVGDQNGVHTLDAEIRNHFFESREVFPVDRERRVALLIIDI